MNEFNMTKAWAECTTGEKVKRWTNVESVLKALESESSHWNMASYGMMSRKAGTSHCFLGYLYAHMKAKEPSEPSKAVIDWRAHTQRYKSLDVAYRYGVNHGYYKHPGDSFESLRRVLGYFNSAPLDMLKAAWEEGVDYGAQCAREEE